MDNQPINFEEYTLKLSTTMAEAIAEAERLQVEAKADREAAHTDRQGLNDLLRHLENEAQRAVEDDVLNLRKRLKTALEATLAAKLKNAGRSEAEIADLLST